MIHYSQRDSRWKFYKLGFGDDSETIESKGCLLTACASVLSSYGFVITPKDLNEMLKGVNGFNGSLLYFGVLQKLFPVKVSHCICDSVAPMTLVDAQLDKGNFVIVEIDASIRPGFKNHWVTIYKKHGGEYFIFDPWTLNPEKETVTIEARYGRAGRTAEIIKQILFIEPVEVTVGTSKPSISPDVIESIENSEKVMVTMSGVRLRTNHSTKAPVLMTLEAGTELFITGEPIKDGNVTWQPVLLYVASNFMAERYLKPVK